MLTLDNSIVIGSRFKITEESIVRYMKFTIERNGKMSIEFQIFFGIGTPCKTYEEAMKE